MLVFLLPGLHVVYLCQHAALGCASHGAVLLHAAAVVPHRGHITVEQRARDRERERVEREKGNQNNVSRSSTLSVCVSVCVCVCVCVCVHVCVMSFLTWRCASLPE